MSTTQFIKNPFTSRFCEMMNTPGTHDRKIAKYLIGQPNPASITNPGFWLSVTAARSLLWKIPDECCRMLPVERLLRFNTRKAAKVAGSSKRHGTGGNSSFRARFGQVGHGG